MVEVLDNCVIFNDGIHRAIADKLSRAERTIVLHHGEKMLFGQNREQGLVLDGLKLKAVTVGQDGYTSDDVLVHDAHEQDMTLHLMLALMKDDLPVAMGVIRDVKAPTYDASVARQISEVQATKPVRKLRDLLLSGEVWEIK